MTHPVTLVVDGQRIVADRGEPVASALLAAGRLVLGRSVKYHRPRGAACHAGRCDGCLMRVGGVANVMTCRVDAEEGMEIQTQNVLGSADTDLLSVTDWFFPKGIDHHHMFTRFGPINRVMQKVARRIAGVGKLPAAVRPAQAVHRETCDVVVAGGGVAGLLTALSLAGRRLRVVLVEEDRWLGGSCRYFPGEVRHDSSPVDAPQLAGRLEQSVRGSGVVVRTRASVVGVYDKDVAVVGDDGLTIYAAKAFVSATGSHEGATQAQGNDTPGVLGARAVARLIAGGVLPGEDLALVGEGRWTAALRTALPAVGARVVGVYGERELVAVNGSASVESVDVLRDGKSERVRCDGVAVETVPSAAFELASQAGAGVMWRGASFVVDADPFSGETKSRFVFAVGENTGRFELEKTRVQAEGCATAIAGLVTQERAHV